MTAIIDYVAWMGLDWSPFFPLALDLDVENLTRLEVVWYARLGMKPSPCISGALCFYAWK